MKRFLIFLMAICLASAAPAQTEAEAGDDRSRLVRFIENALSDGPARDVRIEGFQGALSSTATLDRLTIADADGIWLTIEGAELSWTRSALLRGALEVDRLSAERVVLDRLPQSEAAASPEATPFSLPELPVSISLSELRIDRVELGAELVGFPISASANGRAHLADGQGDMQFDLRRLDGPRGQFSLSAGYDNATAEMALSLSLEEEAGGIAATLLGLPGLPSVDLSLQGQGPVDDVTITAALATDGVDRLTGSIVSGRLEDGTQRLTLDLGGDLAALVLPDYRDFFGSEAGLSAVAQRFPNGAITLDRFDLHTAALRLGGTVQLDETGAPLSIRVAGDIRDPSGDRVRLPVGAVVADVIAADLLVGYDRADGDSWDGAFVIEGLHVGDIEAETVRLGMGGTIIAGADDAALAVTAAGLAEVSGLSHADDAIQAALGQSLQLGFDLSWQDGAPLVLRDIALVAQGTRLGGSATMEFAGSALQTDLTWRAEVADLSPFSGLAGQSLSGAAVMQVVGAAELLSGAFDLSVSGTGTDLDFGDDLSATLLSGETEITAVLRRDSGGLHLDQLDIDGAALSAQASGRLSSGASSLQASARLSNAALLTSALSGPLEAELSLERTAALAPWTLDATASGQGGLTAAVSGQVGLPDGAVDLNVAGTAPLALADPFIAPRSIRGMAGFDLSLRGQPGLAALSGSATASGLRVAMPTLGLVLEETALTASLSGSRITLSGSGGVDAGGRFTLEGSVDVAAAGLPGQVDIGLSGVVLREEDLFQTVIETGGIRVAGALAAGPTVSGQVLLGQTDILLEELSFGSSEPIPDIRHVGESGGQFATRDRAGLIGDGSNGGTPVALDLTVTAPARIFLRGRGLDAELGGEIRLGGTSANVIPSGQFQLIRGRLSLLGQRFDMSEATVTLQGSLDPYLRVVAITQSGDVTASIILEGPASAPVLSLTSMPDLPEDEILSRLLFGRSATSLSAVQAIQLVDAVSGFAGGSGLITGLRESLGVDDFDLTTDDEGAAQLRLGRYISENLYSEVEIGQDGDTEVLLNLDLTPSVTVRGGVASDGESSLGVFFERDY